MRIVHDETRCASLGICEAIAPELFEVGEDGALCLLDPSPPRSQHDIARHAVASCPTGALDIEP
jgi:ferredoxin